MFVVEAGAPLTHLLAQVSISPDGAKLLKNEKRVQRNVKHLSHFKVYMSFNLFIGYAIVTVIRAC
jgi:hypothetical protein